MPKLGALGCKGQNKVSNARRQLALVLYLVMLLALSAGCGTDWEKKFIRKREKPPEPLRIAVNETARPYDVLYKEHFNYWKNWHRQLIQDLGVNHKREVADAREARRHLTSLTKYLKEQKAKELQTLVARFDGLTKDLGSGNLLRTDNGLIANNLEGLQLAIENKFDYRNVKGFMLPTPVPLNMNDYQGDEPLPLPSAGNTLKSDDSSADSGKNADDNLTYEKYRTLPRS